MPILIHGAGDTSTAEALGALPLTGGTLTGGLWIECDNGGSYLVLYDTRTNSGVRFRPNVDAQLRSILELMDYDGGEVTLRGVYAPTEPTDAANKGYVDSRVPQFVKLSTEGDEGDASYVFPAGNWPLEDGESVLIPFRFLRSVSSSEGQYYGTIDNSLYEGTYQISLYRAGDSSEPLGLATVQAKESRQFDWYDNLTPNDLVYFEIMKVGK